MTPAGEARIEQGFEHAATSETWLRHTLEEILSQIRVLLDVDGCAFQTIDLERSHITPAASWFETPELRSAMQPVFDRPYDPARGGVTEAAVERGETVLITDMEHWRGAGALRARLAHQLTPEAAADAWEWYRTSSFISCPVRTSGGRTIGVLALSASPPRPPFSEEHLRVTEVFASLAALALERSELLEREASRARTEELLHGAAQTMTASLDLDGVYGSIVEQAVLVAKAPMAVLTRLDLVTQTLRAVASSSAGDCLASQRFSFADGMLGAVARTGEPYASRADDGERCLPWSPDAGVRSFAHVPVGLGPRRFGVLSVGHREAGALGARELGLLQSLSRPAAGAIANALEFRHEQRIARALTRGFIPDAPPQLDDFALGLVYEPADEEVSGGDVFGVWRLPGGALAVLVGDVSGKGLEVAAVSAMVRFFIEARTWDSDRPAAVLQQTNAILRGRLPGGVALVTAFLAIIDGGVLRYANAGHVPPLVVGGGGRPPRELPTTGLPLGVEDEAAFEHRELEFGSGELLFASTDGLTEARRDGELYGEARVSALVSEHAASLAPQALVELAYARAVAWARQLADDVAIIALRRR
ncbi:MAG: hypothetical protein QOJ35_2383 [Solirubrobacteraceae bacterium]|jgi:serine phosphatase RsbU (regulator of sigma subunit)|nr:hypothetical protein [Solirubrobacteraceae bacterium]